MKYLIVILLFNISCMNYPEPCDNLSYSITNDYKINVNQITPLGIRVDSTSQTIDLNKIDKVFETVYNCIEANFPSGELTQEVRSNAWCNNVYTNYKDKEICKNCIIVKIPDTWEVSCSDDNEQVLQDSAPQELCDVKNLNNDCPCRWRAFIDNNILITTPNLRLLPDILTRYITSCYNPWSDSILETCVKPLW